MCVVGICSVLQITNITASAMLECFSAASYWCTHRSDSSMVEQEQNFTGSSSMFTSITYSATF